jgi:hypothetical protein
MSPKPILTDCGGENEPPCPPQPAALPGKILLDWNFPIYTRNEMLKHGKDCYLKGKSGSTANSGS